MNARQTNAPAKILRLGVIHGGKIVEERLVRKRQPVVVGESPKSTMVLPATAGAGAGFRLFDLDSSSYQLCFTDKMQGRVAVDDNVLDFATLKAQGLVRKKGDVFVLPLADKARGKVVLGDVTILFQFVVPPPEAPKPQLPLSVRSSMIYAIDWPYTGLVLSLTALFLVFRLYLQSVPVPEELTLEQIDDRFVKMIAPQKMEAPPEKAKDEGPKKPDAPKAEKKEEKKEDLPPKDSENKEAMAARRKEIQQKVAGKGVLALLGTLGKSGVKGAVADVFGEGKAVSGDIDKAFQGIGGIDVAQGGNTTSRGGTGSGTSTSIGGLQTAGGGKVGLGEKAEQRVGNVHTESPDVDGGSLDPAQIARVVKGRLSAVKECYERELKRNPQLAGKVVVRFTVDEDGRVSSATIEENSLGDKAVGACIVERFERFRFPKPDGGSVTVSFPFVFAPSS